MMVSCSILSDTQDKLGMTLGLEAPVVMPNSSKSSILFLHKTNVLQPCRP